jgi:hypothetical protein
MKRPRRMTLKNQNGLIQLMGSRRPPLLTIDSPTNLQIKTNDKRQRTTYYHKNGLQHKHLQYNSRINE